MSKIKNEVKQDNEVYEINDIDKSLCMLSIHNEEYKQILKFIDDNSLKDVFYRNFIYYCISSKHFNTYILNNDLGSELKSNNKDGVLSKVNQLIHSLLNNRGCFKR